MTKHTPGTRAPLADVGPSVLRRDGAEIWRGDTIIALAVGNEECADEMIRRYNSHAALVEAAGVLVQECLSLSERLDKWNRSTGDRLLDKTNNLRAALSLAEKGTE